jgi:ribonuclease H / adenosylcobalamin/alpha-ribazole phosphatase
MSGETVVYVVRHGRTSLNEQGRFRGLQDVPLDERGRTQAEAVARALAVYPIVAVSHSPLARARETAQPIARELGLDPQPDPGLLDLNIGAWTGLTAEEAERRDPLAFGQYREDPRGTTPPGGEPLSDAEARIVRTLDVLASRWAGREIVAVSHEVPIRLLLARVWGLLDAEMWDIPLETGSVAILSGSPGAWRVARDPVA